MKGIVDQVKPQEIAKNPKKSHFGMDNFEMDILLYQKLE